MEEGDEMEETPEQDFLMRMKILSSALTIPHIISAEMDYRSSV
jgi:hypothetical protein